MLDGDNWRQLVREPRFWAALIVAIIRSCFSHHVIADSGGAHDVALVVLDILEGGTLVSIATWSPKRRPWTPEERAARGLPPLPPPPTAPSSPPQPPPPIRPG